MNWALNRKKVNNENDKTKPHLNILPVDWDGRKIQTKVNFTRKIVLEMSLMSKDEYIEPDEDIISKDRIASYHRKTKP